MRTIYLSPHLDDAILSAGGLIFDQTSAGNNVEIWTFMCGFPGPEAEQLTEFARHMHGIWGTNSAEETIRIRREEDLHAANLVGAKPVHFEFLDCIYRRDTNGAALYPVDVFEPPNSQDVGLPALLAQSILGWLQPDDSLICQLGIGGHVDHTFVRQAAELVVRLSPSLAPLAYDADVPYILNYPDQLAPATASMNPEVQLISATGLTTWMLAIEAYASQQSSLFDSADSMRDRIQAYWSETRGIRFWTAKSADSRPGTPEIS